MTDIRMPLPAGVTVFERGWLSSNGVLIAPESGPAILVDTGYVTHAEQTLALVNQALRGRPLDVIVNTHLHSDHCGGNASLQAAFPSVRTLIPPGQWDAVQVWDTYSLTYTPTGQECPKFRADQIIRLGDVLSSAAGNWEAHSAPGHDPHSLMLFDRRSGTLISADALWEHGFGVVFPELEGAEAFTDVANTLDLIERLSPTIVIPGHGKVFTDVTGALTRARERLDYFQSNPHRHATYAAKVLIKFQLLAFRTVSRERFGLWAAGCPLLNTIWTCWFYPQPLDVWIGGLIDELVESKVLAVESGELVNR